MPSCALRAPKCPTDRHELINSNFSSENFLPKMRRSVHAKEKMS